MAAFDFLVFCRRGKKGRDKGNACQNIGLYAGRRNHGPIWGYSTAQIAQVLEKNETTVRSLLSRGRKQLKQVLKEAYDFAD